ncbi:MAG: hypothetical protein WC862_02040 [Patescibacteria group bacterium]
MAIFIPNENIEKNQSFGQAVNKAVKEYIEPELKRLDLKGFSAAGIEILSDGTHKVCLDQDVQIMLEFKNKKINPSDTGKAINVDLHEIKDVKWHDQKISKSSAKILVIHFNKDWWIWDADFKKGKELEEKFRVTTTHKIRGGGYLPLGMRRQEKKEFLQGWRTGLDKELPAMWKRHITVSQRYRGAMVYDGNYFDLFSHAQELYVLGYYYSSIVVCRTAAEQAIIRILAKVGKGFEIYYPKKNGRKPMIKGIRDLVKTCRDSKLFHDKYPINKTAEKKLKGIALTANDLVHPKHDLDALDVYEGNALKCMDGLQYVIKNHLNFIKDTGTVSGYKISGSAKRLK